jgi:hypothetical protein
MSVDYSVIVDNIGTVYLGPSIRAATSVFREYVNDSRADVGRASGERVTLCAPDGEPLREHYPPVKLPALRALARLVAAIKRDIRPDYRVYGDSEDDSPGIQLTIGWKPAGKWSYQTGDNSYTGGAYGYPHWAVIGVYRDTVSMSAARDIRHQLSILADG